MHVYGILPKGPYQAYLRMADRALSAGYPRCEVVNMATFYAADKYKVCPPEDQVLFWYIVLLPGVKYGGPTHSWVSLTYHITDVI